MLTYCSPVSDSCWFRSNTEDIGSLEAILKRSVLWRQYCRNQEYGSKLKISVIWRLYLDQKWFAGNTEYIGGLEAIIKTIVPGLFDFQIHMHVVFYFRQNLCIFRFRELNSRI